MPEIRQPLMPATVPERGAATVAVSGPAITRGVRRPWVSTMRSNAALAAPERVASLALLSSVVLGKLDQPFVEGFLAAHDPQAMRPWIEMLFAAPALVTPELIDDLVRYKNMPGTDADLWAYARTVLGEASLSDLARHFEELAMPTLVVFGDQDRVTPPPSAMPPGSILVTGAGHMPHIEAASRVNALLSEFMARND